MFRNLKLRMSFTITMLTVYFLSLPLMISVTYYVVLKNAEKESMERAELMLTVMKGIREYVGGTMRPLVEDIVPDRLPVELTSGFYIVREVSAIISESQKEYSFKFASLNPLNPANKANQFETEKINEFREGRLSGEWKGFVKTSAGNAYAIMTPIKVDANCFQCHGDPLIAPEEQVKRYGVSSGYNWKDGEIIGANTVYVPVNVPIQNAKRVLVIFSIVYSLFFFAVIMVIDKLIKRSILRPIEGLVLTADEISRGKMDREFEVKANNEIKTLADAFTRMKISLVKAMDMLKKK